MKKILLALFLVSSALTFSARVVKSKETVTKENIVYVGQEKVPYTGVVETYSIRGILEEKTEFKDGKKNGISKIYYPNGKLASEASFKDNIQVGVQKDYYENGKVKYEFSYKNGQIDGVAKEYYPNGKIKVEEPYKNGKVIHQATFKNGEEVK